MVITIIIVCFFVSGVASLPRKFVILLRARNCLRCSGLARQDPYASKAKLVQKSSEHPAMMQALNCSILSYCPNTLSISERPDSCHLRLIFAELRIFCNSLLLLKVCELMAEMLESLFTIYLGNILRKQLGLMESTPTCINSKLDSRNH